MKEEIKELDLTLQAAQIQADYSLIAASIGAVGISWGS